MTYVIFSIRFHDGGTSMVESSPQPSFSQGRSHDDAQVPLRDRRARAVSLVDVVLSRRSIRRYEKKEVPLDVLDRILEAGRSAPSAANRQSRHFILVTDHELKKELSKGLFNRFIKASPLLLVGCAHVGDLLTGKWSIIDTSIAMQNMVIAAWSMGVGSCWIGDFDEGKVKQLLKIPANWKVVALITLGYPAEQPKQRRKKPTEKLFSVNKFK